jgi:hypothetical protein
MQTGEIIVWKPLANGARHTFYKVELWTRDDHHRADVIRWDEP